MRKGDVQAALNKGVAEEGGYLAPVEWDRTITGRLKESSPIREHASVVTITGNGFRKVYTDRAITSGWVGETAARPATAGPGLTVLDFGTGEIYANPQATQQILDDAAIDLEAWLASGSPDRVLAPREHRVPDRRWRQQAERPADLRHGRRERCEAPLRRDQVDELGRCGWPCPTRTS